MPTRCSLFLPNVVRASARIAAALVTLTFVAACSTDQPNPTGLNARVDAARGGVPAAEGLASPAWQSTARDLVSQAAFNPITSGHAYALLGVAEYLGLQQAEAALGTTGDGSNSSGNGIGAGGRPRLETDRGAVAGASAVVLSYLFPTKVQMLEDMVTAQANAGPGGVQSAFVSGEAIGRAAGAAIVTRAMGDHFNNAPTPPELFGTGYWVSVTLPLPTPVAGGTLPGTTPWFLTSPNQFRPGPPPTFGGTAFNIALAEIRQISDTRTAAQSQIAAFWALNAGTPTAAGFWLDQASQAIVANGLSERQATHVFALTSATMMDALISCWDAKLTYWLIRPWMADPGITVLASVGKPNHPSYPSGHSCVSSSGAAVIASFFPDKTAQLNAMVTEAGLSRMYGGIHYRFDIEAGQALGRSLAQFTIAQDASGNSVLTAH
jgi:membrane-associated phospholipid phosphatase